MGDARRGHVAQHRGRTATRASRRTPGTGQRAPTPWRRPGAASCRLPAFRACKKPRLAVSTSRHSQRLLVAQGRSSTPSSIGTSAQVVLRAWQSSRDPGCRRACRASGDPEEGSGASPAFLAHANRSKWCGARLRAPADVPVEGRNSSSIWPPANWGSRPWRTRRRSTRTSRPRVPRTPSSRPGGPRRRQAR